MNPWPNPRLVTFTLMPLAAGVVVVLFALTSIVQEPIRPWLAWLVVPAALAVALLVALLLNFSIFAPVYWALGRRKSKNGQSQNERT
jgi:hypothetical protein